MSAGKARVRKPDGADPHSVDRYYTFTVDVLGFGHNGKKPVAFVRYDNGNTSHIELEKLKFVDDRPDPIDPYKEAIRDLLKIIDQIGISTGYCCCGNPVDGHGMSDEHYPVDEGDYHLGPIVDAARKLVT